MKAGTQAIFDTLFRRYGALAECKADILEAYEMLNETFARGGKLLVCGNGGSASDSEHIVGELLKSFAIPRPVPQADREKLRQAFPEEGAWLAEHLQQGLPAIALNSNSVIFTAYCNDVEADMAFAQQVYGYGRPGDVLLGISTSGNAANVNHAVRVASAFGLWTIGLCKEGGGALTRLSDCCIRVPETETYAVQELHLPIYHALCAALEYERFGA